MSRIRLSAFIALTALCAANSGLAQSVVDQTQPIIDTTVGGLAVGGPSKQVLAQVVTQGSSGGLTGVGFPIACSQGSDVTVEVQGIVDGRPDGVVLTSETISGANLPPPPPGSFRPLGFSEPVCLSAGDQVAIVLSSFGSCATLRGPEGDPYDGGEGFFDTNPPAMWYSLGPPRHDLAFETYVDASHCAPVPSPSLVIGRISLDMAEFVQEDLMSVVQFEQLDGVMADASFAWSDGDAIGTTDSLREFEVEVDELTVQEDLLPSVGHHLVGLGLLAEERVLEFSDPGPIDRGTCAPVPTGGYTVLGVGPGASVGDALALAEARGYTAVEIRLEPGTIEAPNSYFESGPLEITRPTIIANADVANEFPDRGRIRIYGELVVRGDDPLRVENVTLYAPNTAPASDINDPCAAGDPRGAGIWLDHGCAFVTLANVRINNGLYGVYQRRGFASLQSTQIVSTDAIDRELASGVGLLMCSGGAQLSNVQVSLAAGSGIVANGPNTNFWASNLEVFRAGVNPARLDELFDNNRILGVGFGGIFVGGEATAEISSFRVDDNLAIGIYVQGGAEATLDGGRVTGTEYLEDSDGEPFLGHNIMVVDEAYASVTDFQLQGSVSRRGVRKTLCGIIIARDAAADFNASLPDWAPESLVTQHTIGACIQVEGFDISRLTRRVRYLDNTSNLDSSSLPVPDATGVSVPTP